MVRTMGEPHLDVADHKRSTGVGLLVRRGLWIGSNLVVGYYATFGTWSIFLVWVDDEITEVVFRSTLTIIGLSILIGIGAALNVLLRLLNRDVGKRKFWTISAVVFSAWSGYFLLVVVLLDQYGMFPVFWYST